MSRFTRSSSPHGEDETTRLQTEYNPHIPVPPPKPSEKTSIDPRTDRLISRVRLGLRILSFLLSSSVVGAVSYAVFKYRSTKDKYVDDDQTGALVRVWLGNLKTRPTYVLLGVSCVATLLSLVVIAASFVKAIRHVTNVGNLATAAVSVVGSGLWIATGIYYKADDLNNKMHLDIVSYACGHKSSPVFRQGVGNAEAICGGLRYAWWAVTMIWSIELFALATVSWAAVAANKKGKYSKI